MSRGRSQRVIVSALIGCTLIGCGGGGGGGGNRPPPPPTLTLSLQAIKAFHFAWTAVPGVTHYKLLEDPAGNSGFTQVGADINASVTSLDHFVPLHRRINARYILQACAAARCSDSNTVTAPGSLGEAVGYFKAQSISLTDVLGTSVALSADGATLAVGMPLEDSDATGVGGDPANDRAVDSGAVYVFARVGAGPAWVQQAYIKASNAGAFDRFGHRVALDAGGATLAVGAPDEDESGATYVFERSGGAWTEQALLKSSNAEKDDGFGDSLALSGDGRTLAVGARFEDSGAIGIGGNAGDNSAVQAGAVYVFVKEGFAWRQDAYIKASNTGQGDQFGTSCSRR
jgi:hypothetical protein